MAVAKRTSAVSARSAKTRPQPSREQLADMAARLTLIQQTTYVCVAALESQMCDRDHAIAKLLQRHVADALESEIGQLRAADSSEVQS